MMRFLLLLALIAVASPAYAWWQYAEWGMTPTQVMSASGGKVVPCRSGLPVCAAPPGGGLQPSHAVESLTMVGMPGSASFAFDAAGHLVQTVILFPDADVALVGNLLQGVHGQPSDADRRIWNDTRRGTIITAVPAGRGTMLVYRPAAR